MRVTICSSDIPLQVLIRPFFSPSPLNSNMWSCKPVLQWLLTSPHLLAPKPPPRSPPHILWNTAISWRNERGLPHTPGLAQQKRGFNHVSKATRGQVSAELSRSIKFDPFESCERIRSVTFAGAYIFINVHISQLGTPTIDWGGVISNEMQGESF